MVSIVALRKESVDRNMLMRRTQTAIDLVALRKESVDRNQRGKSIGVPSMVALRKESVDRNVCMIWNGNFIFKSLSARRAWIEITKLLNSWQKIMVSLSARRAWIEIFYRNLPW